MTYNDCYFKLAPACFGDLVWRMSILPHGVVKARMQLEDHLQRRSLSY